MILLFAIIRGINGSVQFKKKKRQGNLSSKRLSSPMSKLNLFFLLLLFHLLLGTPTPTTTLSFPRSTSHTWIHLYALVIHSPFPLPFPFLLSLLNPFNNILKNMDSYSQDAKLFKKRGKKTNNKQVTQKGRRTEQKNKLNKKIKKK